MGRPGGGSTLTLISRRAGRLRRLRAQDDAVEHVRQDAGVVKIKDGMRQIGDVVALIDLDTALEIDAAGENRHMRDDLGGPEGDAVAALVGHPMIGDGNQIVISRRYLFEPPAQSSQSFVRALDGPYVGRPPGVDVPL